MSDYKRLTENEFDCSRCKDRKCTIPDAYCCDRLRCEIYNRLADLEDKIKNGTLVELGYHIRKSYRNHDDQRYKIILIDEVEIDKIDYDGLTKAEAEARLKELNNSYKETGEF